MHGAQILGVVARLLEDEGFLAPIFETVHEQSLTAAKQLLSEETFASQLAIGRSMEINQAIDFALQVNGEASITNSGRLLVELSWDSPVSRAMAEIASKLNGLSSV